jgi:fumarate reductase subunit C
MKNFLMNFSIVYLGVFIVWFCMVLVSVEHCSGSCGNDLFTQVVKVVYYPILKIFNLI